MDTKYTEFKTYADIISGKMMMESSHLVKAKDLTFGDIINYGKIDDDNLYILDSETKGSETTVSYRTLYGDMKRKYFSISSDMTFSVISKDRDAEAERTWKKIFDDEKNNTYTVFKIKVDGSLTGREELNGDEWRGWVSDCKYASFFAVKFDIRDHKYTAGVFTDVGNREFKLIRKKENFKQPSGYSSFNVEKI